MTTIYLFLFISFFILFISFWLLTRKLIIVIKNTIPNKNKIANLNIRPTTNNVIEINVATLLTIIVNGLVILELFVSYCIDFDLPLKYLFRGSGLFPNISSLSF